jgi:hypothetical protein
MTSVDAAALADRLSALIASPELRRAMGEAGRKRANETFDWAAVFRQYQALWRDLDERRRAALDKPEPAAWLKAAPSAAPDALDPFHAFRHYPTARIEAQTLVALAASDSVAAFQARRAHALFSDAKAPPAAVLPMLAELAKGRDHRSPRHRRQHRPLRHGHLHRDPGQDGRRGTVPRIDGPIGWGPTPAAAQAARCSGQACPPKRNLGDRWRGILISASLD